MSISVIAAVTAFFAAVILSQRIAVQAGARLDDATKLKIVEIFPKRNANFTIVVLAIVVLYLIGAYAFPQYLLVIGMGYAVAFLAYLFTKLYLNVKKLREIEAPEDYIRRIILSFAVFIGGAVAAVLIFGVSRSFSN